MNKEIVMPTEQDTLDFSHIAQNNPSGWILRTNLTEATGGMLNSRTEANNDSKRVDCIEGRIVIGKRKIAYPVESVIKKLQEKCRIIPDKD
jgi:hypothetical protein